VRKWDMHTLSAMREVFKRVYPEIYQEVPINYESQNYPRMHRVQAKKL